MVSISSVSDVSPSFTGGSFQFKIKGLLYSSGSKKLSKFKEFDHKMVGFFSFIKFSCSEISFLSSEQINLVI